MRFVVATHGHCFDGLASAAVFTKVLRESVGRPSEVRYRTCGYSPTSLPDPNRIFDGDENALLDYRFLPHERLTWYFDHHRTAFGSAEARATFDARTGSGRYFYDADYGSCTKLIADTARTHLGVGNLGMDDLVAWADRIDTASFESPEQAISTTEPLMQLVTVIEHFADERFVEQYAPLLMERPVEDVARLREIRQRYKPLGRRQARFVELVREKSTTLGRVVYVDLTEGVLDALGKFVTYALFPDSVYSVTVALLKNSAKVSVGYNPWSGRPLDADISAICARHGGGGHPVVGAVQLPKDQVDRARSIARQIATELAG
jgi:hypothetical protein